MHYRLFYEKVVDHAEREQPLAAAHRAHVFAAVSRGELVLGGPLGDPVDGSNVLVFRADSATTVERFAAEDPFVVQGIVNRWRVRTWATVVGRDAIHPLADPTAGKAS